MDIRVRVHLAHFWKIRLFLALFGKSWYSSNCQHHCQQGSVYLQQLVVASAEVLEKSQIFQKCAKCTLTLMSNFDYKFRFYTSKLNEICLHCHCLYFSSMILSFGQGVITLIERFYIGKRNEKWIQNRLSVFYTIYTKQNSKKKDVAHNKGKIKVSLVVYYVETFECWL